MMFSQNEEEKFVLEYFGDRVGRALDVGAYDGKTFSNVMALILRGWGAVMVEPDPDAFRGLLEHHGANPAVTLVPFAIAPRSGMATFHSSRGGGVSTLSESHRQKWSSAATFETISVGAWSPDDLLERYPGPYPMFNLDVEGQNADLLELFPLRTMGVELLCIEHDNEDDHILSFCEFHGLTTVRHRNAENLIVSR